MRLLIFLISLNINAYSQENNVNYFIAFEDIDSLSIKQKSLLEKDLDDRNLSQIIFEIYFADSVEITINDTLFFEGYLKTNVSCSCVEEMFTINRLQTDVIKISFNHEAELYLLFDRRYRYLRIERIRGEYKLVYSNKKKSYR
jgi:hypothetical protein